MGSFGVGGVGGSFGTTGVGGTDGEVLREAGFEAGGMCPATTAGYTPMPFVTPTAAPARHRVGAASSRR